MCEQVYTCVYVFVSVWGHCVAFRDLDNKWVALNLFPVAVSFCTFPSCYRSLLSAFVKVQAYKLLQLKGHETKLQEDDDSSLSVSYTHLRAHETLR